jgi:hypothetical protein
MKNLFIFLFLGFVFPGIVLAQIDSLYEALNESIEEDNGMSEILEELQKNPFNINTVSREELRIFPFLNDSHIDSIFAHRPFSQKRQVKQIIDKEAYNFIRPFFIVKPVPQLFQMQITQRNTLPMYKVKGIKENKFRGNEYDNYSKIRFQNSESITGGILLQKDLGENEIYDHYSGFLQWQKNNLKIILGNYQVQFGHGLIMDSPYGMQKSIFTLAPLRTKNSGGRHYLSSSEFTGFNGIFAHYSPTNNLSANVYYANTLRDGNIDFSYQYVTGTNTSGYHRTDSEYNKKDLIKEKTVGGNLNYSISENIEAGLCAVTANFNPTFVYNLTTQSEKELRRNHFRFSGEQINLYSLFLHSNFESFEFSTEISTNQFDYFSHSYNLLLPTSTGGVGFKWWHISKQFQSPFGHSFATGSNFPQAVQGFYIGFEHRITEDINCSSFWTTEKDLWRTYFNPLPTLTKDFMLNLNFKVANKTDLVFRYQFSDNNYYDSDFPAAFSKYRRKIRLDFIKHISKNIRVRSRIEKVFINYSDYLSKQEGTNLYQDISWQISPILNIRARFSSFITDNYDSRIYEFENDIPGTFSNYALNGKGNKWYLLIRLNVFDNLRIWLKYRTIYYDGIETIGSGNLQSEGNTRQDVRVQLSYSY